MTHKLSTIALASLLMASSAPILAFEIESDNPDISMRFDNTVKYNYGQRVQGQNPSIISGGGTGAGHGDGDRNFNKGDTVVNRVDLLTEFDFSYKNQYGFRISGASWYDKMYDSKNLGNLTWGAAAGQLGIATPGTLSPYKYNSSTVNRYYAGPSGEILDAFVFAKSEIEGIPVALNVGRRVEVWGESLFSNTHSIAYSQMPIDQLKALSVPGSEVKDLYRPLNNISLSFRPSDNLTIAAQYFLEWESTRLPEAGTYFGMGNGGPGMGGIPYTGVYRMVNNNPKQSGDWGVSARLKSEELAGTVGVYYREFSDKTYVPQFALLGGAPVMSLNYAEGIKLLGLSFSKQVDIASLGFELSYRKNMTLKYDAAGSFLNGYTNYLYATRGLPNPNLATLGLTSPIASNGAPGPTGSTMHGLVNAVFLMPSTGLYSSLSVAAELQWNRLVNLNDPRGVYAANRIASTYNTLMAPTRDYYGMSLSVTPTWLQVYPGVDLSMPISYNIGLSGVSAVWGGGVKDAGTFSIGLSSTIDQKYFVNLTYNKYIGEYLNSYNYSSSQGVLSDRAWVGLTLKTSF